ncbi:MAG: pilus assembly protein N-terminal domain-containing protein [Planctomycetota bacterium]
MKCAWLLCLLAAPLAHAQDRFPSRPGEEGFHRVIRSTYHGIRLERDLQRIAIADPDRLESLEVDDRELLFLGKEVGRTSVILYFQDGSRQLLTFSVEEDLSLLEEALREIDPSLSVSLAPDRDALVLRGQVPDIDAYRAAEAAAQSYLGAGGRRSGPSEALIQSPGAEAEPGGDSLRVRAEGRQAGTGAVINLIRLETLPPRLDEKIREAIASLGGEDLTVRRVLRGDLPDDERDVFVIDGRVKDQSTLVQVLTVASRLLSDGGRQQNDVQVLADESGALVNQRGGSGQGGTGQNGPSGQGGGLGGSNVPGLGGGGSVRNLQNRIQNNIGRAKAIELADGRILSFVEVEDLPQVRVNVQLYEVNRTELMSFAADWAVLLSDFDQSPLLPAGIASQLQGAGASSIGASGRDIQGALSSLGGTLGSRTQAVTNHVAVDVALSLLETRGIARRLSEPSLLVLNGELGLFQVGGEIPVPQAFAPAFGDGQNAGVFSSVEFRSFGVQLAIRPLVDRDWITLDIQPQIVLPDSELTAAIRSSTGSDVQTTAFESRSLRTSGRLRDGESLILGGLVSRRREASEAQPPLLGDIPLLGWLFSSRSGEEGDQELVIVVNPVVVRERLEDLSLWDFPGGGELLGRVTESRRAKLRDSENRGNSSESSGTDPSERVDPDRLERTERE